MNPMNDIKDKKKKKKTFWKKKKKKKKTEFISDNSRVLLQTSLPVSLSRVLRIHQRHLQQPHRHQHHQNKNVNEQD